MFSRLSPLTTRILVVNAMPLVLLVVSILYFDGYQNKLIQNELDSMMKEAQQFAAALGEGAVVSSDDERDLLSPELAQSMLRRLMETTETRTRLYDIRGDLFSDTQAMHGQGRSIESEPLPPPGVDPSPGFLERISDASQLFRAHLGTQRYPLYNEKPNPSSEDYQLVEHALDGDTGGQVWQMENGHLLLGVAVPIQRYKGVLGAVFLSRPGVKIEEAVTGVRVDIVRLFLLSLVLTILLSLYLARTIAKPLQQLSIAAEGLKAGQVGALKWQTTLPDFSKRQDEIGDLSTALRDMVQALGERMHAIESFAADVAHEIKNPLTSLHSAVETALKIKDTERQQKLMAIIADDVKRLDRLITDISQASRLEAELSRAKTKHISLPAMLEMVVGLYAPLGDEAETETPRIFFEMKEGTAATILGAESRLVQVFQNLIDNAMSFSPAHGVVRVTLDADESANRARITVCDEGPGIPENKLDAIFERFYSERPGHEKFGQHSGLGLSIAKQIIEAHQGRIIAVNMKDENGAVRGACFTVELPLSKGA